MKYYVSDDAESVGWRLAKLLTAGGFESLEDGQSRQFVLFFSLLIRWNARLNLTAIRDEEGILARHFVESIVCARCLPGDVAHLLDFGSGAGFPGIPIALCRPEITVTLAESQIKKAAFLQEAVRVLGLSAKVRSQRAETLKDRFDCVTLRAVDRMPVAVKAAADLVDERGWLALMTTGREIPKLKEAAGPQFRWPRAIMLPGGEDRLLALGQREAGRPQSQQ